MPRKSIPDKPLSDRQKLFVEEYLKGFNITKAYKAVFNVPSVNTAAVEGHKLLKNPKVRAYKDKLLKERAMSKFETLKGITDIAKGQLNDYLIVREIWETPREKKPLSLLIEAIKAKMEDEDKFIVRAGITDKEKLESHTAAQESRRKEILRYEIELERNPEAFRFQEGEPVLKEIAELDMVRLAKDCERGRIKSYKMTEFGVHVELYPADAALRDLARVHGLFEKDNEQAKIKVPQTLQVEIVPPKEEAD